MNVADLQPRRHEPPAGWDPQTFEAVTDAIARALVGAVRREREQPPDAEQPAVEPGGA